MTVETDLSVTPVAARLLACLKTEIGKVPDPPKTVSMRVGLAGVPLVSRNRDECREGLAWVRVAQLYPSRDFPQPDGDHFPGGPLQWAVVLELGAARCAPAPGVDNIPTVEQWDKLSRAVLDDAAAMRRAICAWAADDRMYVPGQWQPTALEGGCVGGTQLVTAAIGACDCSDGDTDAPDLSMFTVPGFGDFVIEGG